MSFNILEFQGLLENFYKRMQETDESICSIKLSDDKWTLKEMVGHLIDSASNNHQRFVRLQIDEKLEFPAYDPEKWNQVQKVNSLDWQLLISLWKNYNELLLHLIKNIDEKSLKNFWIKNTEQLTLEFIVNDYFRHLKWHLDLFEKRVGEIMKREK